MDFSKYIIIDNMGIETPIISSSLIDHSELAKICGHPDNVISAGFFDVKININKDYPYDLDVVVFGDSKTLKKRSRPQDKNLIWRLFREPE